MERNTDIRKTASAATIKAAKILKSKGNFARLKGLGGDLRDDLNRALEIYIRSLREKAGG
jgi:hypothetical protein